MFEALGNRLTGVFDKLRRRGALSEADVQEALREVRIALLEADVALPVVKDLIAKVRERAVGVEVIRSVSPAQQVVKIVNDALVDALGGGANDDGKRGIDLIAPAPVPILMVGLQGSGKIALRQLAERAEVVSLPIIAGQTPLQIAERAMDLGRQCRG